jgi:putative transposase
VSDHALEFPVNALCRVLRVSQSGYYRWANRTPSRRKLENERLGAAMVEVFKTSRQSYGRDRLCAALNAKGYSCGRGRVERLKKALGLACVQKARFKATTNSRHPMAVSENLLQRSFTAARPNQKWVSDVTFIPTMRGWLYLAVVIDLYSRCVAGWRMSDRIDRELVSDALKMAINRRRPGAGLLHHSDRGVQYASLGFQALLQMHGMVCSMSRHGNCWDNAVAESFFHTLKTELVRGRTYETREEAKAEIFEYVEVFYNRERLHSTLGFKSPAEYERSANAA